MKIKSKITEGEKGWPWKFKVYGYEINVEYNEEERMLFDRHDMWYKDFFSYENAKGKPAHLCPKFLDGGWKDSGWESPNTPHEVITAVKKTLPALRDSYRYVTESGQEDVEEL